MKDRERQLSAEGATEIASASLNKHVEAIGLMRSMCQQFDMGARPDLVGDERTAYFYKMAEELDRISEGTIRWPEGTLMRLFPDGEWVATHSVTLNDIQGPDPLGTIRGMFVHLDVGFPIGCFVVDSGPSRDYFDELSTKEKEALLARFDENHISTRNRSMDSFFAFVTEDDSLITVDAIIPAKFPPNYSG